MSPPHILAIDQGTSGTKAVLVDAAGTVTATATYRLTQRHPGTGLVEQSPYAIWASVLQATAALTARAGGEVAAVALSTQRESVLLWDTATGAPLSPVVSWQDRRGAARCRALTAAQAAFVTDVTGLPVDPMFSATKAAALLDTYDPDRRAARAGAIRVGTLDAWLLRRLTGTDRTEVGNASRTLLLDLATGDWHPELLDLFDVPRTALAEPVPSTGPFGHVTGLPGVLDGTPVAAVLGDSHAALFAQSAGRHGIVKATYGSGSSLMALAPQDAAVPPGLARTIAWQTTGPPALALEANIASSGTTVRWAADLLGTNEAELAALADTVDHTDVIIVPAFEGLGAPYWDRDAQALMTGLGFTTGKADIARAAIESVAYQVADTVALLDQALFDQAPFDQALFDRATATGTTADTGSSTNISREAPPAGGHGELRADGGPTGNNALMQFQADLCGRPVARSAHPENSALGAARLAGIALGLCDTDQAAAQRKPRDVFTPARSPQWRSDALHRWHAAVRKARPATTHDHDTN